ncbi:putative inositol monophosphatase 3 [Condylostylus longicornis]|uniref:putative inositol monophosphatase 3 n=1 Tax=Condylostylus longicornis TaxID=2530218 RepID=UPI00244E4131|nr:putative inositol monophosphatase 3 [Condylostylus longicornis]
MKIAGPFNIILKMLFHNGIRINRAGILLLTLIVITLIYLCLPSNESNESYAGALRSPNVVNLKKLLMGSISAAQRGGYEVLAVAESRNLNQKSKGLTQEGADDPVTDADARSHCVMKNGLVRLFSNIEIISEEDHGQTDCGDDVANFDVDLSVLSPNALVPDEIVYTKDVTVWIDPLDATQEYTEKLYEYVTTMVCVAVKGVPTIGVIHSPFSGKTTWAWVNKAVSDDIEGIKKGDSFIDNPIVTVSRSHPGDVQDLSHNVFGENSKILVAAGAGYKVLQVIFNNATAYLHSTRIKKWDICAGNAILNALGGKMTTLYNEELDYSDKNSAVNDKGLLAALSNHHIYIKKLMDYQQSHPN